MNPSELALDISTISMIVMAVFTLVVIGGSALFAFFFMSGKEHSSGKKIGVAIAVMAFGTFFLMCLGVPLLFFGYASYQEPPAAIPMSDKIPTPNNTLPIINKKKATTPPKPKKKFGNIPVEVKPKPIKQPDKK